MFLTKKDVDKHCQEILHKCKNEKDRNLRCLNIAQQYYNVRDYESARRYITLFLSVKDDSPIAHKLFAQCLEYFGEKEKALSEYKYSLSLDPKQPELYLKVCELYADNSIIVDKNEARYWHDKGEVQFPYHPAVHKLKQKMFAIGDSQNGKSFESILLDELKEKSNDPTVNVKLLNFYTDNGRVREAYDRAFKKKINFVPNLAWYQCAVQICKSYKSQLPTSLNEEFYGNYLMALERSLALSVQDVKMRRISIPEGIALLASFDELLSVAAALNNKTERFLIIINHMCGQLCFHTAHILYRKAKWEDKNWTEMTKLISPLLLLSTVSRFDIRGAKEEGTFSQILKACIPINVYRINQAGYILTILAKESPKHFMEKIFHFCVSNYWKERICDTIYNTSNYKIFSKSSFFMKFDGFSNLPDELPKNITDDIDQFVSVTEVLFPSSLHHLVWIGVQYLNISDKHSICDSVLPLKFSVKFTGSLQFSHNSSSSYAENLSKIDIEAFLYACVYCAKSSLNQQIDRSKPLASYILPADVSKLLCSPDHDLWWEYVNQMINQTIAEEHYSRARSIIQRGIENIRLVRNNTLPLHLLVLLGRMFANKATVESDSVRASALENRSLLYWKTALPLLEKVIRKETYLTSSKSMFEYQEKIITPGDAAKLISEGKRFVGMQLVKEKNYSDSIVSNESYEEPKTNTPISVPPSNYHSSDDTMLKTLYEQNTKIIDKLETLFSKQELLSSNQFHIFETLSALSKKIDDIIMPNDCYLDALSVNEQPASPHNASQVANANVNKPAPPVSTHAFTGNNIYPTLNNVQTNFPIYPFGNSTLPSATTTPFPHIYSPVAPPHFQQTSLQNYPFTSETKDSFTSEAKESYEAPNRSIASSSIFDMNTPARVPPTFSQPILYGQLCDQNQTQSFIDFSNLIKDSFSSSVKACEILSTSSPASQFLSQNNSSFFQQVTSSPTAVSAVVSTAPHSFQIPNLVSTTVLQPSVQVPEEDPESDDAGERDRTVEHDPIPDFKPIIPLPDEVVVKTGEEEEDVLFENRAKLYRFANKEWKERGVGPLKILKSKVNGRVRILMRREVVHKICANHFLSDDMNLTPMMKSDRAWVYSAPDFADEALNIEQLCVKFQTAEIASEFYKIFNVHKNPLANTAPVKTSPKPASPFSKPTTPASTSSPVVKSDENFKKTVIAPSILNVESVKEETADASKTQCNGFTFNAKPIFTSALEKTKTVVTDEKKKLPFASFPGFSLNTLSRPEGESKLFPAVTNNVSAPAFVKSAEKNSPLFNTDENALDFSSFSKNADTSAFLKSKDFKGFAGAGAPVFGSKFIQTKSATNDFVSPLSTILKNITVTSSPISAESPQDTPNEGEYEPTAEFTPVIPLPDLIEVKTGEEGLDVLYDEHCKLFRFVDDEWKERGVGKMKILRDPKDGTIRLLMRRDQVHKICCNQRLTANHELKPLKTTEKAWSWVGQDFSDGELKNELLCVRFKTVELATAFKKAFENAQAKLSASPASSVAPPPSSAPSSTLPSLSELFKQDQKKWECKACYIRNKEEDTNCIACTLPKDGIAKPETGKPTRLGDSSESCTFSENSSVLNTTSSSAFSFGIPASTTTSVFSFGVPAATTVAAASVPTATNSSSGGPIGAPVFSFGNFSFGNQPSKKSESGGSLFGNSGFHFGDKSASTKAESGGSSPKIAGNSVVDSLNEKKSEVTSGSFSMFGGTGNSYFSKSTDSSGAFSNFSFKLPRNSRDHPFGVSELKTAQEEKTSAVSLSEESSIDDVEFVSEIKIPEEDQIFAKSLMLPPNYFAYKYSIKDCPGCVGCDEEDRKTIGVLPKACKIPDEAVKCTDLPSSLKISSSGDLSTETPNSATTEKIGFVFGGGSETNLNGSWLSKPPFSFGNIFNRNNVPANDIISPKITEESHESDDEKDTSVVSNDHEPYFEPIIPLPQLVETITGEEDEFIEFCERSKLFRFDEDKREWKERGIGELKVLFHPTQKSYRLLLRREQVHKVVLNQRITQTLNLQPLSSTANSWCWCGMNLPEEQSEPVLEKLAVRFKTEEIFKKFGEIVSVCIARLASGDDREAVGQNDAFEVSNVNEEEEYGENNYDDSYEQDYYVVERDIEDAMEDVENDSEVVFDNPVTLKIFEGDSAVDYEGIIRLVRKNPDVTEAEDLRPFVEFSTPDIPSLYCAEVNKNSQAFLENDRVTILEEDPESERKVTVQFLNKELSTEFFNIYETMK